MSSSPSIRTAVKCVERADAFQMSAGKLHAAGDEWFAVCYFYAAYHLVRAAFIADPVFDSIKALAEIDGRLVMEDRFIERHQGRVDGRTRTLGVNDVVRMLYPAITVEYRRLHAASIAVRYSEGLRTIAPATVLADYAVVRGAYDAGKLRA
jgi:hypothetical protein